MDRKVGKGNEHCYIKLYDGSELEFGRGFFQLWRRNFLVWTKREAWGGVIFLFCFCFCFFVVVVVVVVVVFLK